MEITIKGIAGWDVDAAWLTIRGRIVDTDISIAVNPQLLRDLQAAISDVLDPVDSAEVKAVAP